MVARGRRRAGVAGRLAWLLACACGAAPPPPTLREPRPAADAAVDADRILRAVVARDGAELAELAASHRLGACASTGRAYAACAGRLLAVAARARGLDPDTRRLYEALADGDRWFDGPAAPAALAHALESPGPAGTVAAALLVVRGALVLELLAAAAESRHAELFAAGIGLPCPDVMTRPAATPALRRAALAQAGCIPAGDDAAVQSPDALSARAALEVLDAARQRLRDGGGPLADAVLPGFEPAFRELRIPIPLPVRLPIRSGTLTMPSVDSAPEWVPPIAVLTIAGEGLHLGEPPALGVGQQGPVRLGTVLPGPRTALDALGDDLVQVTAALPPSASGDAPSGPVLIVADEGEPASRVATVLSRLDALPDAPAVALAVRAAGAQSQLALVGDREPETAVALRLVLGESSAMVVASGIGMPTDRDDVSLGRRLAEVHAAFPNEHAITIRAGGDVTVRRLVEVLLLAGTAPAGHFDVVRVTAAR